MKTKIEEFEGFKIVPKLFRFEIVDIETNRVVGRKGTVIESKSFIRGLVKKSIIF